MTVNACAIALRDVSKKWDGGRRAVSHVTLTVTPGQLIALIGPSGCGKSTLLRIIAGLENVDEGMVERGRDRVSFVFQQPSLWPHMTLLENVSLPLLVIQGHSRKAAMQTAAQSLITWGLEERLEAFPAELSGGEQQRGAFARAMVMNPSVICLDEVTSALDPELTSEILRTLREVTRVECTTVIIATHHLGFARRCADHVVFMDKGCVVEQGDTERMFQAPRTSRLKVFLEAANQMGF